MSALNRLLCGAGTCEDLLSCVYNLNKLESEAYFALLAGAAKMDDLSSALGRDRSTVSRALQKLVALQLAMRDTVSLNGGGYYHLYTPVAPEQVRRRVEQWSIEFTRTLNSALATFEAEAAARRTAPMSPPETRLRGPQ